MNRKVSLTALLLHAVVILGVVGSAAASPTLSVTITVSNSNGTQTATLPGVLGCNNPATLCVNLTNFVLNGVQFGAQSGATTNTPGTVSNGFSNDSNLNLTNSAFFGTSTITVDQTATGFLLPVPASILGSATVTPVIAGTFGGLNTNALVNGVSIGTCSIPTALVAGACNIGPAYQGTSPFDLEQITQIKLGSGASITTTADMNATPTPEPASMLLLGTGLLGVGGGMRRRWLK